MHGVTMQGPHRQNVWPQIGLWRTLGQGLRSTVRDSCLVRWPSADKTKTGIVNCVTVHCLYGRLGVTFS